MTAIMAPKPRLPDLPSDDDGAALALPPDDEPPGDGLPSLPELSGDDVLPDLPPSDEGNTSKCPFSCAYKMCACLSITPSQKEEYASGEKDDEQQGELNNFRFHYVRSQMIQHDFDGHYRFEGEHVCVCGLKVA